MSDRTFQNGDFVRKNRNPGTAGVLVDGPIMDAGDVLWKVRLPDGNVRTWDDGTFEKVPHQETIGELLKKRVFGRKTDFSQLLTFHRLVQPLTNNIYSLHSNRIEFMPFQFKPLLKFIDSPNRRLLIADDVGLGKTIEAGLILSELKVRSTIQTVLVVCPAHLREKWRMEMRHRFGEEFELMDAADFKRFLTDYRESNGCIAVRAICSLQSMRSDSVIDALESVDPRFDFVIVDEAHHMRNSATRTHRVGQLLSRQAESLLFLTATPVQTHLENLFNLLRLLDADHFQNYDLFQQQLIANENVLRAEAALAKTPPDIEGLRRAVETIAELPSPQRKWFESNPVWSQIRNGANALTADARRLIVNLRLDLGELNLLGDSMSRTRKQDVMTNLARREAQVLRVTYSPQESEVYQLILNYVRSKYPSGGTFFEKAAMMTPQRRAASSLIGAARFYLREGGVGDFEDYIASLSDSAVELPGEIEEETGADILSLFQNASESNMPDGKYDALCDFLQSLQKHEKVIVFSTFPSTLEYLEERLGESNIGSKIISGRVPVGDRLQIVEAFRDNPKVRVLLSSEVGGEGLDLQFSSIIVNYDLPWNPMVVAQRIGRVDRIGQRAPNIRIINFSVKDTIDQTILERLYNRIGLFQRTIGLTDGILGEVFEHLADAVLSGDLSEEARAERIEQEALAAESRLALVDKMDEQDGNVFISDSYLQDEVSRANKLHRYVSDKEVHALGTEFLGKYFPRTILTKDPERSMTYSIDCDKGLQAIFANFHYSPGERMPAFISTRGTQLITFDVNVARSCAAIEHINLTHPFIRLVIEHYEAHGHEFARTSYFRLRSTTVPKGAFLIIVHKLVVAGVRPRVLLLPVVVNMDSQVVLDEDTSEVLVAEMITGGHDMSHLKSVPHSLPLTDSYQKALVVVGQRDRDLRIVLKSKDAAFRARRVASLRAHYDRRIERQHELAIEHGFRGNNSAMVKGFVTRAKNLENEREGRITEIEQGNPFEPETEEVLAAVVYVHE